MQVHRRTFAFGTVTQLNGPGFNTVSLQLLANAGFVKRLDAKTEMIDVAPFPPRRHAAFATELSINGDKIDQGSACAKLDQSDLILPAFNGAGQHFAIERQHCIKVDDAQDNVIDFADVDHAGVRSLMRAAVNLEFLAVRQQSPLARL